MNLLTRAILLFVLLLTLSAASTGHLLSHFDKEFKNMAHVYQQKDTSKAFSIAMKIFTSI